MFFPRAMTAVELIIPEKDLLAVTNVLAGQGVFHQVDASHLKSGAGPEATGSWRERASAYAAIERQVLVNLQALTVDEGKPRDADAASLVDLESLRPQVEEIERAVKQVNDQIAAGQKELEQLQSYVRELQPVAALDLDVKILQRPSYIHAILGLMPVANLERLQTSLARIPHVLLKLSEDRQNAVVWLTGTQGSADILDRAARSAYLNPLDLSDVHEGKPPEIIKSLQERIRQEERSTAGLKEQLKKLSEQYGADLQSILWRVRASRMLAEAMSRFGKLRYTYLVVGWIPTANLATLREQLKQASKNIIIEATASSRSGEGTENVPVSLRNPGLLGAFEQLVNTYARPRYEEVDPTVLMTFTFPLLFGAMFGDIGQGFVLALLGWLVSSGMIASLKSAAPLGRIVMTCGFSATVFGFLYGSFFGFEGEHLPFPELLGRFVVIEPIHQILQILGLAVGAGVVLLSFGFLLNLFNAFRARDWARFFFDPNGVVGIVLYWSLLGFAASSLLPSFPVPSSVFLVGAGIGAIGVMFSEVLRHLVEGHRPLFEGGPVMLLIQSGVELFEKGISLLSNTLSYVRVGAFAVVHAGLMTAIFTVAELFGGEGGVAYWIVVVLGNIVIIGVEGLIVGIQTMRLHYYEFFSKFFTGGGLAFDPLKSLASPQKQAGAAD